ncbi:hypothetical protein [Psychrobacillus sp. NPDC096623]|uniref:hypothetical protein n=1 Tax=Psychrobacillus sp. NPDC096623 TaxID=3364492 RepID=UPI00380F1245
MKKHSLIVSFILLTIGLLGCQQNNNEKVANELPATQPLETKAEVIEEDFVYRLVTEQAEYGKNEPIKIYAELEYTGDKEEIEIFHSASPFYFPMIETTRNYVIEYGMNEPLLSTKLIKGEPLREEFRGGSGSYVSEDKKEYRDFIRQIMKQEFPEGNYVVNGVADFYVIANRLNLESKNIN